jgi:methionine synthase II (cobalamin-independent)
MFATLLGGLPRPPVAKAADRGPAEDRTLDALVRAAVEAQETAGLEPLTDGRLRWRGFAGPMAGLEGLTNAPDGDGRPDGPRLSGTEAPRWVRPLSVDGWRFAAGTTTRAVKQALPGPYTLARRLLGNTGSGDPAPAARSLTIALAAAIRAEALALAEAGCPFIEIEERDAGAISEDEGERHLFREAHLALTDGLAGIHLSLAIVGGNADTAGAESILTAPYSSLALDLIDGPDNWRLARAAPGERGIVAGALSPYHPSDDGPELLLWAVGYAASMNGRGVDRVGLATAGSLGGLSWELAERKLRRLGTAARLAATPPRQAAEELDPRSINIKSAAVGRPVPIRRARRNRPG